MYAWSYSERKRVEFIYSHIRKTHEPAFTTRQVAEMVARDRVRLEHYITAGEIRRPQQAYTLDGNFRPTAFFWQKKDVLELHDYLMTIHYGRPRKDGQITPKYMPTKSELRAMMDHDTVYYVKNSEGKMVKAFKEAAW
jgi:hypothetical protein